MARARSLPPSAGTLTMKAACAHHAVHSPPPPAPPQDQPALVDVYRANPAGWRERLLLLYNKVPHWNEGALSFGRGRLVAVLWAPRARR